MSVSDLGAQNGDGIQRGPPPGAASFLGGLFRKHRRAAGLSQEELGRRCGLSARALSDIERGRTVRPFGRSVRLVADALELDEAARAQLLMAANGEVQEPEPGRARETEPGWDHGTRAGAVTPRPRQLPAAVRHFVGRTKELTALNSLLAQVQADSDAVAIAAISGTAGVGKTALAVHWAHEVARSFPDGQLYVDLRGRDPAGRPLSSALAVRGFLEALGVPAEAVPAALPGQTSLYRSLVAGRHMLIVLDNAHSPAQVRPLLPGAGCLVMVTSRSQQIGLAATEDASLINLEALSDAEAREFLAARLGSSIVCSAPGAITELIGMCANLPLALGIAAARAASSPALTQGILAAERRDAAGRFDASGRLDALECGDPAASMRTVLSWSYRGLASQSARMFRFLGLHPGPDISAAAAASLVDTDQRGAQHSLSELVSTSMLTQPVPGRYAFHDLLRSYAGECADREISEPQRQAAVSRMLDHYLHSSNAAAARLVPTREPVDIPPPVPGTVPEQAPSPADALAWFASERAVLLAVTSMAATAGYDRHAWQLPWTLEVPFYFQGRWHEWASAERIALAAAARLNDQAALGHARAGLGNACIQLGRYRQAAVHLEKAARHYRRTGDSVRLAMIHLNIARVLEREHRLREALEHAYQALRLSRAAEHRATQAKAMNVAAWYHAHIGEFQQAIGLCEQALEILAQFRDLPNEAAILDTLGYTRHSQGQFREAASCFERAADLFRDAGDRYYYATVLSRLGDARCAGGGEQAARQAWQQALEILEDLHHDDARPLRARLQR